MEFFIYKRFPPKFHHNVWGKFREKNLSLQENHVLVEMEMVSWAIFPVIGSIIGI